MTERKTDTIDLGKLREPFPAEDIEWRVSRAGISSGKTYCHVLAYITARAIQSRLDDVCGPANWRNEPPQFAEIRAGVTAVLCGISIRINDEWITKWDVAEPTNIEPAKGGFSGAMKRAGAQWGIGRYLYHLDETFAEVSESGGRGWNWARLPEKVGGGTYYWKTPSLPGWALPKEPETECAKEEVFELVGKIRAKLCPDNNNPKERQETITRFVHSVVGEFPVSDYTCWTRDALDRCTKRIEETTDPDGVSPDVPFDSE
jgi:hypothetical protein